MTAYDDKLNLKPPTLRNRYPHMTGPDAMLWRDYILQEGTHLLAVAYDVCVGEPAICTPDTDAVTKRMWQRITSKRIDVVALVPGAWHLIEVKCIPDIKAPGQARAYAPLFANRYKTTLGIQPILVCRAAHPDIDILCDDQGVRLIVISRTSVTKLSENRSRMAVDERT